MLIGAYLLGDPINVDCDDLHCEALEACQRKNAKGKNA